MLLTERLDQLAATTPAATAVADEATTLTYADLRCRAARLALALRRRSVRPIDRVALLLPDRAEFLVGLFACFRVGAVAVPLRPNLPARERERVVQDCAPCLALVAGELPGNCGAAPALNIEELREERSTAFCLPDPTHDPCPAPEDLALLVYTSGTTASPKGVMHLHGRLARAAVRRAAWLGFRPGDRVALLSPLTHALGMMGALFPTISAGATLLLPPRGDDARTMRFLARHGATFTLGTPSVYAALAALPEPALGPRSLRRCYSGGDALPEAVQRAFAGRYGIQIRQMCGMTELPGYCAVPGGGPNRPGSIGLPQTGIELRLVPMGARDAPGGGPFEPLPAGEVGEIWVKSDVATVGYWNNPAATAALLLDGWIRTGDLARTDEEGYLYFVGRRAPARR